MDEGRLKRIVSALLSEEGRTEAEAKLAREKAAQLLADHDMTAEELLSENREMKHFEKVYGRHAFLIVSRVGTAIATLTGTECWQSSTYTKNGNKSDRKKFSYAGYAPDVEWAEWLLETIVEAGMRTAKGVGDDRSKSDMLVGFADTVCYRIYELAETLDRHREEKTTGTDLVVVKEAEVGEYVKSLVGKLVPVHSRGRSLHDMDAVATGRAAGESVGFGRPVGQGGPLLIGSK